MRNIFKRENAPYNWRVAVYIPSTTEVNQNTPNGAYIRQALTLFSREFGGASAYKIVGAWESETEGLVIENPTIVYAYTNKVTRHTRHLIRSYAKHLQTCLKQESVAFEIIKTQGGLFFS